MFIDSWRRCETNLFVYSGEPRINSFQFCLFGDLNKSLIKPRAWMWELLQEPLVWRKKHLVISEMPFWRSTWLRTWWLRGYPCRSSAKAVLHARAQLSNSKPAKPTKSQHKIRDKTSQSCKHEPYWFHPSGADTAYKSRRNLLALVLRLQHRIHIRCGWFREYKICRHVYMNIHRSNYNITCTILSCTYLGSWPVCVGQFQRFSPLDGPIRGPWRSQYSPSPDRS